MIKQNVMRAAASLACLGALVAAGSANGSVVWTWSFNGGAEAGTVTTNGTLADLAGPFNFLVIPSTIDVTASTMAPSLVSQTNFDEGTQPGTGWLWDGSEITQIYRSGGTFTNGLNWYAGDWRITFGLNSSDVVGSVESRTNGSIGTGFRITTFAAVTNTVPEPSTNALVATALLVALGTVVCRRRSAHSRCAHGMM